jgi:transcriptional regulator with XRE-family HTH domain
MQHIGKTIKGIIEEKGLTQQQIAELVHMPRSNYSNVESGEIELSMMPLIRLQSFSV